MGPLTRRLAKFATSPEGRRLYEQARRTAKDPDTRRRVERAWSSIKTGGTTPPRGPR